MARKKARRSWLRLAFDGCLVAALATAVIIVGLIVVAASVAHQELPTYEVVDVVNLIDGGRGGDVILPTMTRHTPAADREKAARLIAATENLRVVHLYDSAEARKADVSASYAKDNPGAVHGSLGYLEDGRFTAAESMGRVP